MRRADLGLAGNSGSPPDAFEMLIGVALSLIHISAKPGGRQIAADSAELLRLATELKAEVDKTNTDTLSIPVVRKAGEIEKLARSVKQKGRAGVGGN